jgi:hypothetical protein
MPDTTASPAPRRRKVSSVALKCPQSHSQTFSKLLKGNLRPVHRAACTSLASFASMYKEEFCCTDSSRSL